MPIVIVIDTNVLRYALEAEKGLREDEETRESYQLILHLIENSKVVFVANSDTKEEYYRHLEALKTEIRRRRIVPQSFSLLRLLRYKIKVVETNSHEFSFEGKPVGRKDLHLLKSAKEGALFLGKRDAVVITFAEDVYRGKNARNGKGVVIHLINLRDKNERKKLERLL